MKYHVNHISSVAWCHLRNLFRIRRYLTTSARVTLVHAFVTSRLDLYNCLLYKFPNTMKNKLQRILNCSAKLIFHGKKYDSVTPLLKKLHWLPVEQRIQFKILLTTFKCLNGKGPSYLTDLLIQHTPHRVLRSSGNSLPTVPRTRLKNYGDKTFAKAAPELWNNLPIDIRSRNSVDSFKKKLDTSLQKELMEYSCMLFEHLIVYIHFILDLILNIAKALMNRTILKSALYKYIYLSIIYQ